MAIQTCDYIIVGGGTAGSVLASRLSHSLPNASILLLEAGPASDPRILPALGVMGQDASDIQWNNRSIPQKGLDGNTVDQVQGKVMGGSSAINYQTWTRGARTEFDQWAKEVGDDRWNWEGILPYFKKSETYRPAKGKSQPEHGYQGPITITQKSSSGKPSKYLLRSMVEDIYATADIPTIDDINNGSTIGLSPLASNTYNGERQYGAVCYPRGKNVIVWTETTAVRLIIENKNVTGVQLVQGSKDVQTVTAKKEVIVTSGAQGSTKLLLLSGIGPRTELDKHSIKQVEDLPVGENYSDHPLLATFWKLKARNLALGDVEMITPECDWTAGCPADFLAYHHHDTPTVTKLAQGLLGKQELERFNVPGRPHTESFIMYLHLDLARKGDPHPGGSVFTMFNILTTPTSVGTIRLSSSNPRDPLLIDPALFSNDLDKQLIYECTRMTTSAIMSSPIATKYGAEEFSIRDEIKGRMDDEAIHERLMKTADTINHGSGTCAMGKVVDAECKVKGVRGLRVVDSSVIPFTIGAHYQAIVYAIAEKVSEMIVADAGCSDRY